MSASPTASGTARCPAGSWAPPGAPLDGSFCVFCSPGTYAPAGVSPCLLCPAGTYGSSAGLTSAACSGPCTGCPAGTAFPPSSSSSSSSSFSGALTCGVASSRQLQPSLGLQLWPAAHPQNPQGVDLVVAPLAACAQITASSAACAAAASIVGADGVTRYVVGTTAALNMQPAEQLTCASGG